MTGKRKGRDLPIQTLALLLGGALCASIGTLMLKEGANGRTELLAFINVWIVGGLAIYGMGSVLWIFAMARQPLSVVYPFTALSFVLVLVGAIVIHGERPSPVNLVGIAVVIAGIGLVVWGRQ